MSVPSADLLKLAERGRAASPSSVTVRPRAEPTPKLKQSAYEAVRLMKKEVDEVMFCFTCDGPLLVDLVLMASVCWRCGHKTELHKWNGQLVRVAV